ncbi:nucleotidyltransferase domain-containing protein [Pelomicrobium sp. G1]|uniref:nucleotidyltransferase domain-containing protein n=1 Tax=unclassified Pelomicrobium TaxID=2815318 RepID=UPI000AF0F041
MPLPPPIASLVTLLARPESALRLDLVAWDGVVRVGRTARLLAALRARLERAGMLEALPAPVRNHLDSEAALARFQRQAVLWTLARVEAALEGIEVPQVLLKGAAYLVQGLPCAQGRLVGDVDLLVPRDALAEVEARLREAGWQSKPLDAHDERYYRQWTHELPPLRHPEHALELDVHHTILPPLGKLRPPPERLLDAARPVPGSRWRVLAPADQVLHAAAHLFHDSDCSNRLRDLADLDSLLRGFGVEPGFWEALQERAQVLGLGRPLWYGLHFAGRFFGTPVPRQLASQVQGAVPPAPVKWLVEPLIASVLPPPDPDRLPGPGRRLARRVLLARATWLKLPLGLLVQHMFVKARRSAAETANAP